MKRSTGLAVHTEPNLGRVRRCLLVSLRPRHAFNILNGTKTFEFRRVSPRLVVEDEVIVYATAPVSAIVARFRVSTVLSRAPQALWRKVSSGPGLSKAEFHAYFEGRAIAHAIGVGNVEVLAEPLELQTIRVAIPRFCPPQSYWYLNSSRSTDAMLMRLVSDSFAQSVCNRRAV